VRARAAEAVALFGLAAVLTAVIAGPVLLAPSERVFGMPIVGRHHDPFTVMEQFRGPIVPGVYLQPVTDIPGVLLARITGPIAAYNWLVLASFPLSAVAAYLLARHLTVSPPAAAFVGLAYAFSPFHLAQAAYHPHIAQTHWLPLYLLALWRCLDRSSLVAVVLLVAAAIAVTLSNFYGGLIAAVTTPVAVLMYWSVGPRDGASLRRLGLTAGVLTTLALAGVLYVYHAAAPVVLDRAPFSFPREDLFRYSAKWWGYLLPPVAHPLLGAMANRVWSAVGVGDGLLEQQVSLGWSVVAFGLGAVSLWLIRLHRQPEPPSLAFVPALAAVAFFALVCSLSPERLIGPVKFVRPSALLYETLPMFRSYARFGVVVQLMGVLLAAVAVDYLRRARNTWARAACVGLVTACAFEYTVWPTALWRDVLPTSAHRWVMRQPSDVRALDCTRNNQESRSVEWLTGGRIRVLGGSTRGCAEPDLPAKLASTGFTHVIMRTDNPVVDAPGADESRDLRLAADFPDAQVLAVTAEPAIIYVASSAGFFPREHDGARSWEWMGSSAAWTFENKRADTVSAILELELSAFHHPRRLDLVLDGRHLQTLVVVPLRRTYSVGPFPVTPGHHAFVFRATEAPTVAAGVIHNADSRALSIALGTWKWLVTQESP
jgi:hypothetical protein